MDTWWGLFEWMMSGSVMKRTSRFFGVRMGHEALLHGGNMAHPTVLGRIFDFQKLFGLVLALIGTGHECKTSLRFVADELGNDLSVSQIRKLFLQVQGFDIGGRDPVLNDDLGGFEPPGPLFASQCVFRKLGDPFRGHLFCRKRGLGFGL